MCTSEITTDTSNGIPNVPYWSGFADHAGNYDGLLLDLWGTVHDGYRPLPGVPECLARVREAGLRVLILSNAPRRNDAVVERMRLVGIPDDSYDAVLSSGEAAWLALRDRADPWHQALGRCCYLMGRGDDDSAVLGLGLDLVKDIEIADFIVCVGIEHPDETLAVLDGVMTAARMRNLPMVCANPDLEVLRGNVRELCAGAIAARYEEMGGDVVYHGKPHAEFYTLARNVLGIDDPRRILCVGDSLRTDVAGGAAAGLDSLLITDGIHAEFLGTELGERPDPTRLAELYAAYGQWPTAAMTGFRW